MRNVIERIFGVVKKRFPILKKVPEGHSIQTQIDIVTACCCIHNFIHRLSNGVYDNITEFALAEWREQQEDTSNILYQLESFADEGVAANEFRDGIASAMWLHYNTIRRMNENYLDF